MISRRLFLRNLSLAVVGGIFVPKYERWFRPVTTLPAWAPREIRVALYRRHPDGASIIGPAQPVAVSPPYEGRADIYFPVATENWGTVTGYTLYDARTGQDLYHGNFARAVRIEANEQLRVRFDGLNLLADLHPLSRISRNRPMPFP